MGTGYGRHGFDSPTIEAAVTTARERAMREHRRYFVVTDHVGTPPNARFGAFAQEDLEVLILGADEPGREPLAILRIATPDGTVDAADDPGDREGRLVAFCTAG